LGDSKPQTRKLRRTLQNAWEKCPILSYAVPVSGTKFGSGSYGIALPFPKTLNASMIFHSVAVAGGLIVAIALALAIHRCLANYRDKKQHGG